jgi:hypothetical protein
LAIVKKSILTPSFGPFVVISIANPTFLTFSFLYQQNTHQYVVFVKFGKLLSLIVPSQSHGSISSLDRKKKVVAIMVL